MAKTTKKELINVCRATIIKCSNIIEYCRDNLQEKSTSQNDNLHQYYKRYSDDAANRIKECENYIKNIEGIKKTEIKAAEKYGTVNPLIEYKQDVYDKQSEAELRFNRLKSGLDFELEQPLSYFNKFRVIDPSYGDMFNPKTGDMVKPQKDQSHRNTFGYNMDNVYNDDIDSHSEISTNTVNSQGTNISAENSQVQEEERTSVMRPAPMPHGRG